MNGTEKKSRSKIITTKIFRTNVIEDRYRSFMNNMGRSLSVF